LLFIGLVALLAANAWLFLPRYVLNRQKLTAADLQSQVQLLQDVALDGAAVTGKISANGAGTKETTELAAVQQRSDDIVVTLQHAPYEVTLNDQVQQSLELAQVISFTLHDASFSINDNLQMSRTSQVLAKAATSAEALSQTN
jgi:hypothetical protein